MGEDMTNADPQDSEIEDIRLGYQAAIDLLVYEGELIWARFNAMLVANTIIITIIGFSISSSRPLSVILVGMPILGMVLCGMWFFLTKRGFDYYKYWVFSARELEERLGSNFVRTVSRGAEFSSGRPVLFKLKGGDVSFQMSWAARRADVQRISLLSLVMFFLIYVIYLIQVALV